MVEKNWKFYLGMVCFVLSFILPLIGLLIPFVGLPTGVTVMLSGFLMLGGPEIMIVFAVLLLGKPVFSLIKEKIFHCFRRKASPKPVSRFRYYFGLIIFFGSVTPFYMSGYGPELLPKDETYYLYLFIASDLAFVLSFFILGGTFREKFRRLFIWKDQ